MLPRGNRVFHVRYSCGATRHHATSMSRFGVTVMAGRPPGPGGDVGPMPTLEGLDPLFRREAPRLLRYFRYRLGNREAAPDLVQESFARLLRASRVASLANPAAYLQRIARNLLVDARRRASAAPIEVLIDELCDCGVGPAQEDGLAMAELLARYEAAVAELSDKTRTVFLLQRVDGLSYRQIQERLGISMGTVEYHMMRAIAHLDQALDRA
jgi:RNA polymerase sigma factor (sigma-70 family)